jgi:hypothetical protein
LGNTEENCEMIWKIWKKCEMIWKILRKSKLNSEKIGKIWKKPVSRAATAAIYPRAAAAFTTTAAAATPLVDEYILKPCSGNKFSCCSKNRTLC